jgi:hypothetical protein
MLKITKKCHIWHKIQVHSVLDAKSPKLLMFSHFYYSTKQRLATKINHDIIDPAKTILQSLDTSIQKTAAECAVLGVEAQDC